jgi:hypothetical protein
MDGRRMDQFARALARGVTRRGALKGIAVAVGLSATGIAHAPAAAAGTWCACKYACGAGAFNQICYRRNHCRGKLHKQRGQPRCILDSSTCGFADEGTCYASFPI